MNHIPLSLDADRVLQRYAVHTTCSLIVTGLYPAVHSPRSHASQPGGMDGWGMRLWIVIHTTVISKDLTYCNYITSENHLFTRLKIGWEQRSFVVH